MKAILFILAMCGFYYGMNQYALSENAVERWLTESQFPNEEGAEKFCSSIQPLTETNIRYTYNTIRRGSVTDTTQLCDYIKRRIVPNATKQNTRIAITNLTLDKIQKFPYNAANLTVNVTIYARTMQKERDPSTGKINNVFGVYKYNRKEKITFSRNFLGDYKFKSFAMTSDVSVPQKNP